MFQVRLIISEQADIKKAHILFALRSEPCNMRYTYRLSAVLYHA